MDYVTLGRTGLQVSVLGLGGGGHSRLGQRTGATEEASVELVRRALALGVTFIDTAEAYGTEAIIGMALDGVRRENVVLSTKKSLSVDGRLITAAELSRGLDASLRRLGTDYVDVYHLHGVRADQYDQAVAELVPAMQRLRAAGKIRFLLSGDYRAVCRRSRPQDAGTGRPRRSLGRRHGRVQHAQPVGP
jgi:aryl-alcohol dehydrogenase-like predicted oxidoreductase